MPPAVERLTPSGVDESKRRFLLTFGVVTLGLPLAACLPHKEVNFYPDSTVRFRFGKHTLTPDDILESDSLLLGETWDYYLLAWREDPEALEKSILQTDTGHTIIDQVLNYPVAATNQEVLENAQAIHKAKNQGMHMVATDCRHFNTVDTAIINERTFDVYIQGRQRYVAGIASGLVADAGWFGLRRAVEIGYRILDKRPKKIEKDSADHKKSIDKPLVTLAKSFLIAEAMIISGDQVLKNVLEILEWSGGLEKEGADLIVGQGNIRNLSMALNAHIVEETLKQTPTLRQELTETGDVKILFFAGNAHWETSEEYKNGPGYLENKLSDNARRIIRSVTTHMRDAKTKEEQNRWLEYWVVATSGFSYPIPTFAGEQSFQYGPPRTIPNSPRALLWQELLYQANLETDESGKSILQLMIGRLIGEDFVFQYWHHVLSGFESKPLAQVGDMRQRANKLHIPFISFPLPPAVFPAHLNPPEEALRADYVLKISEGVPYIIPLRSVAPVKSS